MKVDAVLNAEKTLPLFLCFLFSGFVERKKSSFITRTINQKERPKENFLEVSTWLKENTSNISGKIQYAAVYEIEKKF